MDKPSLIVIALSINPNGGSEPGKAWWWCSALSRFYTIHIITRKNSIELCKDQKIVKENQWLFYPTSNNITTWKFPLGFIQYRRWLQEALSIAESIKIENLAGLHHATLGSFRYLPSYEKLKIPYTLGPLGGGEIAPWGLIWNRPAPMKHKLSEVLRKLFNFTFVLNPKLRTTLKNAKMILATSNESEKIIQAIGGRNTCVIFPDALEIGDQTNKVMTDRREQEIKSQIRLIWQGRPLWWKGPDFAVELLFHLQSNGLPVELTMISQWENHPMKTTLIKQAEKLGVRNKIHFKQSVGADEFKKLLGDYHAFVGTSLHDSGGIPLLEAQAAGLPCLTFGLGGNRLATARYSGGQTMPCDNLLTFLDESFKRIKSWHSDPNQWLLESNEAIQFSEQFRISNIEDIVSEKIISSLK